MAEYTGKEFIDQATQSLSSGKMLEALDFAQQAVALDQNNGEAYMLTAIALSQLSRAEEADQAFSKAVELAPNNPKVYYNLAVHQYGIGKKREALQSATRVIELDPTHASARDLVSRLETELGIGQSIAPPETPSTFNAVPPMRPVMHYQQGFEPSAHALAFVEKFGSNWDLIGWLIIGVRGLVTILNLFISVPKMMEMISDPNRMMKPQQTNPFMLGTTEPLQLVLSLFGWVLWLLLLLWVIFEFIDKRSNWVWIVPFVVCCCCGLEWIAVAIYIFYGRPK
jgi:tetratricopeptide (TPR) repeat protein